MNKGIKILLAIILLTGALTQKKICKHLGFGQGKHHTSTSNVGQPELDEAQEDEPKDNSGDYLVTDSIYEWDNSQANWVSVGLLDSSPKPVLTSIIDIEYDKPVEIDWKLLMDIKYELKYFKEIEAEMYAPIFSEALKAIDGKEVIISGYVMAIDLETNLKALSANPYSSCFFCGKASPASVMSLYPKKDKVYKTDAFKKFKGTLSLNQNDPNEFYYILRDAVTVK